LAKPEGNSFNPVERSRFCAQRKEGKSRLRGSLRFCRRQRSGLTRPSLVRRAHVDRLAKPEGNSFNPVERSRFCAQRKEGKRDSFDA
jgi:hypothetical protein